MQTGRTGSGRHERKSKSQRSYVLVTPFFALGLWGCAGWDNPTALAELETEAEVEIRASRVETFEEVEVHARVLEGGSEVRILSVAQAPAGSPEWQQNIQHVAYRAPVSSACSATGA